jgi:hypothetical protein
MAGTAVLAFSGQAYADGHAKVIQSKSKAVVAISGQIQRAAVFVDDGSSQRLRHMEQGQSESGIDIKGSAAVNSDLKASFHIDMDVDVNSQNADGTTNGGFAGESAGNDINTPKVNMALAHKSLGTMTIGRTGAAADGVAHNSTHGSYGFSQGLLLNNIADYGVRDSDDGDQSGNLIDSFASGALGDPGGRSPMIRYDTPRVAGFAAAVSHEDAGHVSVGANFGGNVGPFKVSIKAGYHNGDGDADNVLGVSGAIQHSSGLGGGYAYTFTMDGVQNTAVNAITANGDFDVHQSAAQVYYKAKFNEMGRTTVMGEWQQARDFGVTGSELNAFSAGIGQNIDSAAISFYGKYIHVDVEAPGESFDDVQAVETGIRMKF